MKGKRSKGFYMAMVTTGAVFVFISIISDIFKFDNRLIDFGSGFGSSLIAVGVVCLFQIKNNPQAMKEREINAKDERFIMLRGKAAGVTFLITMIALAAAIFLLVCLNYLIPCYILIGVMSIHSISYFWSLHYFAKKM